MIDGSRKMGDWGYKTPVNDNVHYTQTNYNSRDGYGAHVTTNISGTQAKVHDRFSPNGDYLGSDFGRR